MKYFLLIWVGENKVPQVMDTSQNWVTADEENKHHLTEIGQKLKDQNLISHYQLASLAGMLS